MKKNGFRLLSLLALLLASVPSSAVSLEDAVTAYNEGRFGTAFSYFIKHAELGDSGAQNIVGLFYNEGLGVTKNYRKSIYWYKKAAKQGSLSAQNNLAIMYQDGLGLSRSYVKALYWYRKSARKGFAQAQGNLGFMYEYGYGVKRSSKKAMYWYKKSALKGFAGSQYRLANLLVKVDGKKKIHQVVKWYEQAASQGHKRAKNKLSELYRTGAIKDFTITSK